MDTKVKNIFKPFPFLKNAHFQTIFANYLDFDTGPPSKAEFIELPDHDKLALEISTPEGWKSNDPTILMVHGLAGSHNSPYLRRISHKLFRKKMRAIRLNLRGCGSGMGHAQKGYHGGISSDVLHVLAALKKSYPMSPITLVGFSLGGNISLKLAGENADLSTYLERVIAICPSIDLEETARRFQKWPNQYYETMFLKYLRQIVQSNFNSFPKSLLLALSKCKTLIEFDEIFTAPFWGFKDALDYYTKSSSKLLIPNINIPCQILFARDDPLINAESLDLKYLPSNISVHKTTHGGHMGFLGDPKHHAFRWMDEYLLSLLDEKNLN